MSRRAKSSWGWLLATGLVVLLTYGLAPPRSGEPAEPERPADSAATPAQGQTAPAPILSATHSIRLPPPPPQTLEATSEAAAAQPGASRKPAQAQQTLSAPKGPPSTPPQKAAQATALAQPNKALGAQLLQQLQAGEGPQIAIYWPSQLGQRQRLFRYLQQCAVMRLARISNGRIVAVQRGALASWSGYIRLLQGQLLAEEQRILGALGTRGQPVRLYATRFDQRLLLGLHRAAPLEYRAAKHISGHYRLRGNNLAITDLRLNGRALGGAVDVALLSGCGG